jgi:HEAT repeat protein
MVSHFRCIGVVVFMMCAGVCRAQDDDPEIRGKKLSEWVRLLRNDPEIRNRNIAVVALDILSAKSKSVLPVFLKESRDNREDVIRARCIELLPKFKDQADRIAETIAAAIKEDKSEKVRAAAARSAARVDTGNYPTVIPNLIDALKDASTQVRNHATESLALISRNDAVLTKDAVPNLIACLKDMDDSVRREAAFALGRMATVAESAVVPLASVAVSDSSNVVRKEAAKTLGAIGKKAEAAAADLSKALQDKDVDVRIQAAASLGQIGPGAAGALPELIKAVKDKDKAVRCEAIHTLGRLGKNALTAIPELLKVLKDEEVPEVRLAAIQELGEFGPDAKQAVEALTIASRDGRPALREAAQEALKKIQKPKD